MKPSLRPLHAVLASLGPPTRFALVLELMTRERCVTELARAVGLSQSCTTRHLQELGRAGVVRGRRMGKRVVFALAPRGPEAAALLAAIAGRAGRSTPGEHWPGAAGDGGEQVHRDRPRREKRSVKETPPAPERESARDETSPDPPARPARRNDLEDYLL